MLIAAADLREAPGPDSAVLAELEIGDVFEVLEFVRGRAWGRAPGKDLVGYIDADALSWPAA